MFDPALQDKTKVNKEQKQPSKLMTGDFEAYICAHFSSNPCMAPPHGLHSFIQ